jgi:hypothetical protein
MGAKLGLSHYGENTEGVSEQVLRGTFGPSREEVTGG